MAIIQFVRWIAAYIDAKTKKIQDKSCITKTVLRVLHCCLWCLEKCVKFITSNAFIVTALYGKPFCSATKHAFYAVVSHLGTVRSPPASSRQHLRATRSR